MTDWQAHHGTHFAGTAVLVTGGAGFIGSHLIEALVSLGARVTALDDLSGGDWKNLDGFGSEVRCLQGSITDPEITAEAVAGSTYIFHQAALGSVPASVNDPVKYHANNVMGTVTLLEAARTAGVHRVVYAGSSSAYGDQPGSNDQEAKIETQAPLPMSPYAATKLAGEHACRAWSHSYGLDTAVTRYFNIFGPRQNPNSAYAAAIAAFARVILEGHSPVIYGDGDQSRDFTFVHNAVHANLLAARHGEPLRGEVVNVATSRAVTINDLARRIAELLGRNDLKPAYHPPRIGDVRHSRADIRKAKKILGYEPLIDFESGLATTIEWYHDFLTS